MRLLSIVCSLLVLFVLEVFAQPDISPSDTSFDFGPVGVGLESDWDVILSNNGNAALVVSSVTPNLLDFSVSRPTFPKIVVPGESLVVTVVFHPLGLGVVSGIVEVISNDPDEGLLSLAVTGQGVEAAGISVSDTSIPAGAQFLLPITIGDVSGMGITSVEMRLVFDNNLLTAGGASTVGTIAELWDLQVVTDEDQLEIRMSGDLPLGGSGVLVYIDSYLSDEAPPGVSTPVILADVLFNEGDPVAIPRTGMITVASYSISGIVSYYKHSTPVHEVLLFIQGGMVDSAQTGSNGFYEFEPVPGGRDYSVTPSKRGAVRAAINSYDAAIVLRYSVGMLSLDPLQLLAADVTGNGMVSGYDVSHILQFRVGIIDQFPIDKEWLFIPEKMDYDSLSSNLADQDYTALVYGDVSGNWPGSGLKKLPCSFVSTRIVLPDIVSVTQDAVMSVPIILEKAEGVGSADLIMKYNSDVLNLLEVETTSFTSDFMLQYHDDKEGVVSIAMAGTKDLHGSGHLVCLVFQVSSFHQHDMKILFDMSAVVNDGLIVTDGLFETMQLSAGVSPDDFNLHQIYPNPFNPTTSIFYTVAQSEPSAPYVTIKIYNALGQEVETLVDGVQEPHSYVVRWDGRNSEGHDVPSGVYYCRMKAGSFLSTRKMLLIR